MALQPLNDDEDAAIVPHTEAVPPPPVPVAPRPPRKPPATPPGAVVRRNKIRDTYKRLASMKTSDINLLLNEQLKGLDANWLKRSLVSIVLEHRSHVTPDTKMPLLLGTDTAGSTLLLTEIFEPFMHVDSMHLTKKPHHLEIADDVSIDGAPFRITLIAHQIDNWETSGIERLDQLTFDHKFSPLRGHDWMIVLQGSRPMQTQDVERRILPRLKLATQPPNFDFSKIRQQLIDENDDESRCRVLKGLHERLWHEMYPGMERLLKRLMVPDRCLELAKLVVDNCEHCNAFAPVPRRPKVGAELAGHVGDCLVVDLYLGRHFSLS